MFRFLIYAIIIYLVYLAIKWAYRIGSRSGMKLNIRPDGKKKINVKDIEDAEFTEIKKDSNSAD